MSRNIIIDGQILQTDAWYRGMGKYTVQVLQELSSNTPKDTKLYIIFNTALDKHTSRFETIKYLCPNIVQIQKSLPLPKNKKVKSAHYKRVLSNVIDKMLGGQDNLYLITSLFQFDFFADFPRDTKKLVLFYDLIPLLFWKDLGGYFPPELYMARFQSLYAADHIFSISETTKKDLVSTFGIEPDKITNINGGFTKIAKTMKKPEKFDVPDRFILFPTGHLPHKNNEVAIKGFEQYYQQNDHALPLVITSSFSDLEKKRLRAYSKNIIFTDNVSDEELEWLFENSEVIIFASKYEGLGMPILDAVASSKPIVTSRIAVFEEMSKDCFYYFNPNDSSELAMTLEQAINHKDFKKKQTHYPQIMDRYTWANTTFKLISTLDKLQASNATLAIRNKKRIAIACIHPGVVNSIGRFAEPFYGHFKDAYEIDYYFDANGYHFREMERPSFLDYCGPKVFDIGKLSPRSYKQYSMIIYLNDSHTLPSRVAQRACILPGIAVTDVNHITDKQQRMLNELLETNQFAVLRCANAAMTSKQIYNDLLQIIKKHSGDTNTVASIIRHGRSNRSIIRKLIRYQTLNDK